jgi:hypothetical protein
MKALIFVIGFTLGMIAGIYVAPVKKGIKIINYNQCEGALINEEDNGHEKIHNEHNSD